MTDTGTDSVPLTAKEDEQVRLWAKAHGIPYEEAATLLTKAALARRVKKRTGKAPARVYALPKKK